MQTRITELAAIQALARAEQAVQLLHVVTENQDATDRLRDRSRGGYSITRAIAALAEDQVRRDAPLELDASEQIASRVGRAPRPGCLYVPISTRDQTAASAAGGGYLVAGANLPGDEFADALRASSVMLQLGVRELPLSPGNQSVPRGADATAVWLAAENSAITESDITTYAAVAMSPKTVGGFYQVSRHWMQLATPQMQNYIMRGLGAVVATAVDAAVIQGTGADGQPTGLIGATGVGTASGATMTMTKLATCIKTVENANGIFNPNATGWAIASDAAAIFRVRERAAGSGFLLDSGRIDGRPAAVSNNVPAGTAIFGDWSQILLGTWSTLEIGTDPYGAASANFKTGIVSIRAIYTVDVGVLRGESFSKLTSIS